MSVASEINLGTELENLPLVLGLLRDLVRQALVFFFWQLNDFILCRSRMPSFMSKNTFRTRKRIIVLSSITFNYDCNVHKTPTTHNRQCILGCEIRKE